MEAFFSERQYLARMIVGWIPCVVEFHWTDGVFDVAVFFLARDAVARSWHMIFTELKEEKRQSILGNRRAEVVQVAMILFDSKQLSFRACLRQITNVWGTIRKVRNLILLLPLLHEKCILELAQCVVQTHSLRKDPPFRVNIDMILGLYVLQRRTTMGFKMHRFKDSPVSVDHVLQWFLHTGVDIESIDYCKQHWHRSPPVPGDRAYRSEPV